MNAGLDLSMAEWVKSSYSEGDGGLCLEFSRSFTPLGAIPIRDSKAPAGPALVFPAHDWSGFVTAVKSGTFPA
ncbi:DUF397 domain-containing protein [Streptomyces sp. URMC 129]|uniref:DUF397 domain-containing protein n=1 Tax=Streptomyces sp. URMC 129 TaxID=3423407 RepID=UPI003F1949B3